MVSRYIKPSRLVSSNSKHPSIDFKGRVGVDVVENHSLWEAKLTYGCRKSLNGAVIYAMLCRHLRTTAVLDYAIL
jgi:hypothetical protein